MEATIVEIAVGMLIVMTGMEVLVNFVNRITNHKTKIDPSWFRVINPLINAYVAYGLLTTASIAAVTTYVYVYSIFIGLIFVVIFILLVAALLQSSSSTKY